VRIAVNAAVFAALEQPPRSASGSLSAFARSSL
jgi:hypothetical protein